MKPTTENIITRSTETDDVIGIYEVFISHQRNPDTDRNKKSKNFQDESDQWLVVINGQRFDYYTGVGHRHKLYMDVLVQVSKPVTPKFDSILACLVQDAVGSAQTFDDWCFDYGYDTDSRKALDTYMACQETAKKLRLARVPVTAEAERLQDY
jgi:hypothetical protein